MNDKFTPEDALKAILQQKDSIDVASNELSEKLSEVIAKYQLDPQAVMAVLAQMSAGFVHQLQREMLTPNSKETIENIYQHAFHTFLALSDIYDVENMVKRRDLN